jgi:acetoin utilization protein AcuB
MLAKNLVSDLIPTVTGSDTVSQIIERMAKSKVAHLPVIENTEYLGLISEKDLVEYEDRGQPIDMKSANLLIVSAIEDQHVYEVIDLISRFELTLLPVLSTGKEYKGSITLPTLVKNFSMLTAAGQPGAILVLSLALQDYSPTMLSRIIEDNNAKIISLYVISDPNGRELTITIKVNTEETSSMIRSFDRFGYKVKSYYLANNQLDDFYRSRYEELMKYMNI